MPRVRSVYRCSECGAEAPKWTGWCPACESSGTLSEEPVAPASGSSRAGLPALAPRSVPIPIAEAVGDATEPVPTGDAELDRVLGGGLVPGSVTVLGGEPGVGKSTLLLQALASIAARGATCLYVTAEESARQVALRAERMGVTSPSLWLVSETAVPHVVAHIDALAPEVVVVDSIQTVHDPDLASAPGSVGQVRGCAHRLVAEAKSRDVSVVLVGHVTKEGGLAGPRVLEHLVDTVLAFEGERHHALRMLRAVKHRFGSTHELGLFEMGDAGLVGVPDPSALFLADRQVGVPGRWSRRCSTVSGRCWSRSRRWCSRAPPPTPAARRRGSTRAACPRSWPCCRAGPSSTSGSAEVHVAVAGGVRVIEPGADLAMALAIASSATGRPLPADLVTCGEIGLGGELRQVHRTERRLAEAARLGFSQAIVPRSAPDAPNGMRLARVASLGEALHGHALRLHAV